MDSVARSLRAMNTSMRLIVYPASGATPAAVSRALDEAEATIHATEDRFSRFIATSELSRLNQSAGSWVTVSPEMAEVLRLACVLHEETEGVFDPAVLAQLEWAGYDRSFEHMPSEIAASSVPKPELRRFAEVQYDGGHRLRLPPGIRIDLGGIVKGWTADRVASILSEVGPTLVDLGGDVAVRGTPPDADGWLVGVEEPGNASKLMTVLELTNGGIATSGINRRRWRVGGRDTHHLIDPRTGDPARTDLVQVVALEPSTARAEVWAKVALISGTDGCRDLIARHPEVGWLLVSRDGAVSATPWVMACLPDPRPGESRGQ